MSTDSLALLFFWSISRCFLRCFSSFAHWISQSLMSGAGGARRRPRPLLGAASPSSSGGFLRVAHDAIVVARLPCSRIAAPSIATFWSRIFSISWPFAACSDDGPGSVMYPLTAISRRSEAKSAMLVYSQACL